MLKIDIGTKVCRVCGRELPISDFYANVLAKDGHRNVCKHCFIERNMQKRKSDASHRVKHHTEMHVMRTCTECGRDFPETEFLDSRGRRVGSGRCRECREKNREYQRSNREVNRERLNKYSRESNRRRRAGEEKRKPGPAKGQTFVKQATFPLGKKEPVKAERLCEKCPNWPCFAGIENLETDFAREGFHGFPRGEAS